MNTQLFRRKQRVRARINGTAERPRVSVWRGNRSMIVQVIDDTSHKTLLMVSSDQVKDEKGSKVDKATKIGELAAKQAKEKGLSKVVFDRGGFQYHGRVKAVAEAMRKEGLVF